MNSRHHVHSPTAAHRLTFVQSTPLTLASSSSSSSFVSPIRPLPVTTTSSSHRVSTTTTKKITAPTATQTSEDTKQVSFVQRILDFLGMGSSNSTDAVDEAETDTNPRVMTERMQEVLNANTYRPGKNAPYTYFLVQLNEDGELPYGDDEVMVSDCIEAYIANNRCTHIIAQTHGWNTPPEKAVAVPFTEFMGGMQNDAAMPTNEHDDFHPIWIAFIWPAVPYDFVKEEDALTRADLLIQSEKQSSKNTTDIQEAAEAAKAAIEKGDENDETFKEKIKTLAENAIEVDEVEDDDDEDENVKAIKNGDTDTVVQRAKETEASYVIEGTLETFSGVLRPLENLAFGRLMKRGRKCGRFMGEILGRFMEIAEGRPKVSLMANSLGAHMLVGALKGAYDSMPYKLHTVFFVQGAISRKWFKPERRYAHLSERVAGPMVCTFTDKDFMLKNIFGPFHGDAVGYEGFANGEVLTMKSLPELAEGPYNFSTGICNSVNSSNYIDEGNAIAGGHGDFKEDETTSLYWSMIKSQVEEAAYDH